MSNYKEQEGQCEHKADVPIFSPTTKDRVKAAGACPEHGTVHLRLSVRHISDFPFVAEGVVECTAPVKGMVLVSGI
jgi:hypothetical protein